MDDFGYQRLKLGMSRDAALKTGMLTTTEGGGSCTLHQVVDSDMTVFISEKMGLSSIFLKRFGQTVKGVSAGTPKDQLLAAYPQVERPQGVDATFWAYKPAANPKAVYHFSLDDRDVVNSVVLDLVGQDCHS